MIRQQSLAGVRTVVDAIRSIGTTKPSILERWTVGSLAGHVAPAGSWVVGGYLDQDPPDASTFASTAGSLLTGLGLQPSCAA